MFFEKFLKMKEMNQEMKREREKKKEKNYFKKLKSKCHKCSSQRIQSNMEKEEEGRKK